MGLFLNQFIAASFSDSKVLIRFSIILAKREILLSAAKLRDEATNMN